MTKLCPPTPMGRELAVHTRVTQEEPTGRLCVVVWGAHRAWLESWVSQPACSKQFPAAKT